MATTIDDFFKIQNLRNIDESDLDKSIYRIIPMNRLLQMFDEEKIYMPKINDWDDPYENFFLKSEFWSGNHRVYAQKQSELVFGQCWSFYKDSDALWRIYSHYKDSVRIKTTIRKLFDAAYTEDSCMANTFIGSVRYMTKKDIVKWVQASTPNMSNFQKIIVESTFMKRNNFSHEKEVRLIFSGDSSFENTKYIKYDINVHNFIEGITFDPRTENSFFKYNKKSLNSKFGYPKEKITKSVLYDFKPLRVEL